MTPTLTDADREAIAAALVPFQTNSGSRMQEMIETIYAAGLAAGMERAAKVCEDEALTYGPMNHRTMANAARACAAAIRAKETP